MRKVVSSIADAAIFIVVVDEFLYVDEVDTLPGLSGVCVISL